MDKARLRGVFPPMLTPFSENGSIDYQAFESNISKWNDNNISGYLVLGSNSETVYLTEKEKLELVRITVKTAKSNRPIFVGSGMESLNGTISLTNKCAKEGAHYALVVSPHYYGGSMTNKALINYYTKLADASEIPIFIYNVPKFTHINISTEVVATLSKHPNIWGMKDSLGDVTQLAKFIRVIPDDFNLMVGTAAAWYPALTLGLESGILALANTNPDECAQIQELFDVGNWKDAKELYYKMLPLNEAITATYGIPGLKYTATKLGYNGGHVRSPLLPITDTEKTAIDKILKEVGLINNLKY